MKPYYFYFPLEKALMIIVLSGLFMGNLIGRLLFSYIKYFRAIYIANDIFFTLVSIFIVARGLIFSQYNEPLAELFGASPYNLIIALGIFSFFLGIKACYFLKINCGDFIDEKQGVIPYISFIFLGVILGSIISVSTFFYEPINLPVQILALLSIAILIPTIFIINLDYIPNIQFAKQFKDDIDDDNDDDKIIHRDDLFFSYINLTYIITYLSLSLLTLQKFYNNINFLNLIFISVVFTCIALGFLLGKFVKVAFWHIYLEMIYPIFFLSSIFVLYVFHSKISFYYGMALFIPILITFGFSLYHTISHILIQGNQTKRFSILNFSILILPAPIAVSLSFISFTYKWFFIIIYILSLMNVIIPGIYLFNKKIESYKKILYFVFSLVFIPFLLFIHLYLDVPLTNDIYAKKIKNFSFLKAIHYNNVFVKEKGLVLINNNPLYYLSDSTLKNSKRSLAPITLYANAQKDPVLFIDSNQKFHKNNMISYYKKAEIIDPIYPSNVDYNYIAHHKSYKSKNQYLPLFLYKNKKTYKVIMDMPNIYDQQKNIYRFSLQYYKKISSFLTKDGVFFQQYNIKAIDSSLFSHALINMKKNFKNHIVFLFGHTMVIAASNNKDALLINNDALIRINILAADKVTSGLLFDSTHLLSHIYSQKLDKIIRRLPVSRIKKSFPYESPRGIKFRKEFYKLFAENNVESLQLFKNKDATYWTIRRSFYSSRAVLTMLKQSELAESNDNYILETDLLFKLMNYGRYWKTLGDYISLIIKHKEQYYYNAALHLEKANKWKEVSHLYNAVITINKNNFDANYRLGVLNIILQDLDKSFKYFNNALQLKKNHPKVLYQLGVLYFSTGKTYEAITSLKGALQQREDTAEVYFYLGLCHEKLKKYQEAEQYYNKAIRKDPNDEAIKMQLQRLKSKSVRTINPWDYFVKHRKNQYDDEQGKPPLPIIKSAYDIRLKDNEK